MCQVLRFKPCLSHISHFCLGMTPELYMSGNVHVEACNQHRVTNNYQFGAVTTISSCLNVLTPVLQLNLTLQMLPSGCTMQRNTPGNAASFYTGCLQKSSGNSLWSNSRAAIWSHLCCLFARNAAFPHHGATGSSHVPPSFSISLAEPELQ